MNVDEPTQAPAEPARDGLPRDGLSTVLESRGWPEGHPAVWTREGVTTWDELATLYRQRLVEYHDAGQQRWGLRMRADAPSVASLAALQSLGCEVFLLDGELNAERVGELSRRFDLRRCVGATHLPDPIAPTVNPVPLSRPTNDAPPVASVTILTSGTSGTIKAARHDWLRLTRPVRRTGDGFTQRWLLAYRPHLYAGLQVLLQALLNRGTLVAPGPRDDPNQILQLMADAKVQFASATPSYWRRLVLWGDPAIVGQVPLRQITLGGEAVDQEILDRLRQAFPQARVVHIYATTELGRCFSVTDGRSGFPTSYLRGASADGVELQVREQQLFVRSANAMKEYVREGDTGSGAEGSGAGTPAAWARADVEGWFPTGDLVEVIGDRVRFAGRASDMINVGGNKVYPLLVEQAIREVPGVVDVRVFGQPSSIAGQLVACEVVPAPGEDRELLRAGILERCRAQLDRYQVPRVVQFVERLELTAAGKMQRAASSDPRESSGG